MDFKFVDVSDSVSIPVPKGLTPEEEANYIASRIAFVNLPELEKECDEAFQLWREGKTIPLETVLEELERDKASPSGKKA